MQTQPLRKLAKDILKSHGLSPKKFLSQNFLVDRGVYHSIIKAGDVQTTDQVLEIGPGLGFLTHELLENAGNVVAYEIDETLADILQSVAAVSPNLTVIHQDILQTDIDNSPLDIAKPYKVIANIPYHITAKIIKKFLTASHRPERMVLLIQKEVAERIMAEAGDHSLLSLSVQLYAQPHIERFVPAKAFYPEPKVDSAVIVLDVLPESRIHTYEKEFWQIVKIAFTSKRKKLASVLSKALAIERTQMLVWFEEANITEGSRPQHLSVEQWQHLISRIAEYQQQAS